MGWSGVPGAGFVWPSASLSLPRAGLVLGCTGAGLVWRDPALALG